MLSLIKGLEPGPLRVKTRAEEPAFPMSVVLVVLKFASKVMVFTVMVELSVYAVGWPVIELPISISSLIPGVELPHQLVLLC